MKKWRTGFTLIELLAVIVILAVIALIATASIIQIIDRSERGALEDSAYGIIEAGNVFYIDHVLPSVNEISEDRMNFEVIGGKFVNVKNKEEKLEFKGSMPKSGKLQIHTNGDTAIAICNHKYCACKSIAQTRVTVQREDCEIDEDTGEIGKKKDTTPIGTVISYMGKSAPEGYLFCDGATYNISEYPKLAEQIKKEFGTYNYFGGNGTSTFAVPNLKGEFLRGSGENAHNNSVLGVKEGSGLEVGKHQEATVNNYIGVVENGSRNLVSPTVNFDTRYGQTPANNKAQNTMDSKTTNSTSVLWKHTSVATLTGEVSQFTSRPTNTSVLYCIKY